MSHFEAVFHFFRCPNCDTFFNRTSNFEQKFTTCKERVEMSIPTMYIKSEKLSDKLDSFGIQHMSERELFENLALFDFESICVQKGPTETQI